MIKVFQKFFNMCKVFYCLKQVDLENELNAQMVSFVKVGTDFAI